jgi:exodeoxyribonuclease V gamma subunit
MIIHHGNRIEALVDVLADVVTSPCEPGPTGPLVAETIAVQGPGMERWLAMELSRRLGVWANARFPFPRRLLARAFDAVLGPAESGAGLFEPETLTWAVAGLLPGLVHRDEFAGPRSFLTTDPDGTRLLQLARRIAETFDHYVVYRPEMIAAWEDGDVSSPAGGGETSRWQSTLWRELVARHGRHHLAARSRDFLEVVERHEGPLEGIPSRVSVFGITTLPPLYVDVLSALSSQVELHLFVLRCARDPRAEGEGANPLWASQGAVGRHFAQLLDERAADAGLDPVDRNPGGDTLLACLQRAIFEGPGPPSDAEGVEDVEAEACESDDSIQVHACHGPMREVEVLHDRLAALFEETPDLEARDVVVMTPDVERYAPYIQAVFDASPSGAGERPAIGYRLADRRLRATDEVVDALSLLLDALAGRLTASTVVDLLMIEAIRRRFEIEESDLDELIRWIRGAGIRWGADADHRAAVGQPVLEQNTWRDGIDRLLLGMALPAEDALYAGHLPVPGVDAGRSELLASFVEFSEALLAAREAISLPRTLDAWSEELGHLLDRMIEPGEAAQQQARVRGALEKMAEDAHSAGFEEPVALVGVRRELERRLGRGTEAYGFLAGGVTFCELVPMRSIPFRVVALLGMGDDAFPRTHEPLGFDLSAASPRPGDRSIRDEDRHLFLEALVSARDHVIVTYPGRSLRDGSPCAPSVVVDELLEEIARLTGAPTGDRDERSRLVTPHPLHAFSPRYFDASDDAVFSFSASDRKGAEALLEARSRRQAGGAGRPFVEEPLPASGTTGPREIAIDDLVRFFEHPVRAFLQRRLGLYLREDAPALDDREPLELDALVQL